MKVERLIEELNYVRRAISYGHSKIGQLQEQIHPEYVQSATNLFHYLVLRSFDLRPYQDALSQLGLSSLRTTEGYVLANLTNIIRNLKLLNGAVAETEPHLLPLGYQESQKVLESHMRQLMGGTESGAKTKIMVTMPTEAAFDDNLVLKMVEKGMNIARINLGHDNEAVWLRMVQAIKGAANKLNRHVTIYMDLAGPKIRTGQIAYRNSKGKKLKKIALREGEHIVLTKHYTETVPSRFDQNGKQISMAEINVSLPQIIDDVAIGDPVLFDDGMFVAEVRSKQKHSVTVELKKCFKPKLGAEKGINLPNTRLNLPALTAYDLEVLPFACQYAGILGYSFVRCDSDVQLLYENLDVLNAKDIGVVFKIENQEAFENFPNILMKGMQRNRIGVMIARGDLAVEVGFERISEIQKELLWICEAAHVPVIWATQVLETLAKKGIPTRAEISDASQGAGAECVMLNKGPYILEAITTLRNILDKMDGHMSKKKESLRALNIAKKYIEWQDQKVSQIY